VSTAAENRYRELFQQVPVGIMEEDYSPVKRFIDNLNFKDSSEIWEYCTRHPDEFLNAILECKTLDVNPAAIYAYGANSKDEFMNDHKDYEHWMSYDWVAFYLHEIEALFDNNLPFQREFQDTSVDGLEISIRNITFFPNDHKGDWSRVMSIIENITDRKKMEAQLHQSQKMETLGQLTESLAHDVNNILAIISAQTEKLNSNNNENQQVIEGILDAVNAGSGLVKQLLSFSSKQQPESLVLDISEITENLISMLDKTLPDSVSIKTKIEQDLWLVDTEPARLENTILNLVLNSRDAMPDGGKIIIELLNETVFKPFINHGRQIKTGDYVVISVIDTGVGMTSGQMRNALDPLYSTKSQQYSSGLGLSSVFRFASQNQGQITIFSSSGNGTEIRLFLPKSDHDAGVLFEHNSEYLPQGKGETILLVEDERILARLVATMLDDLGYSVLIARDGLEALDILGRTFSISLMLTDIQLPGGLSGIEVSKTAVSLHPDIKIQFMSGYTGDINLDRVELEKYGPLLNKPFRKAELAQRVSRILHS
jgi:signal transduction histidine kinase